MSTMRRLLRRLWFAFHRTRAEQELDEELRFHLDMKRQELEANGLAAGEATTAARRVVGNLPLARNRVRDVWVWPSLQGFSLDCKLGLRMLTKFPGLTLVGGLAITVASGVGVAFSEFSKDMFDPTLPLDDGHRIVGLRNWDTTAAQPNLQVLHDYITWRDELTTVEDLSALSVTQQGLTTAAGQSGSLRVAQVTASTFRVTRTPPRLGRALTTADEQPGAPPVVVIGHDVWQRLFHGADDVIGQTVQLAGTATTLVGVMPEGYAFPINQGAWTPLRVNPLDHAPLSGPALQVIGRLAPDASLREAQAELSAIGMRTATDSPQTHAELRPQVTTFAGLFRDPGLALAVYGIRFAFVLLMVVVCANVATLVFARTVMREGEIAVRTALGATRGRIAMQLFAEALVLVAGATVVALVIAGRSLGWGMKLFFDVQQAPAPFWSDGALSMDTILYAAALALVGAFMVGVVPALKATGHHLQPRLSRLGSGSGAALRFGSMWTAVIVVQVALSVAFLPYALTQGWNALRDRALRADFAADEYLSARLVREREHVAGSLSEDEEAVRAAETARLFQEVKQRIADDPGVSSVTLANWLSGMNHPVDAIEIAPDPSRPLEQTQEFARVLRIDPDYFDTMQTPAASGRTFFPAEFDAGEGTVVVNQAFVRDVTGGQNPIGHRLRHARRRQDLADTWHEIVGVVPDSEMDLFGPDAHPVIYRPLVPGSAARVQLFVQLRSTADAVAPRLHAMLSTLDQTLLVDDLLTVDQVWDAVHRSARFFGWMQALIAAVAMLLSMAGTYALMSFAVSQRTREIGIRVAVGAGPGRIVATVFGRAFLQIALGVALGSVVAGRLLWIQTTQEGPGVLLAVAALMLAAGLVAGAVPVRRALHIQPTDALRAGG